MNQAIVVQEIGGPEVLRWQELPNGDPKPNELRVRHSAIGVNFVDTYQRSGLYPLDLPSRLGQEAVGVVDALGKNVSGIEVGDRVAYVACLGAYAQFNCIAAEQAILLPAALGIEDAVIAAGLLKTMTVEYLIRRAYPVQAGQTVLWHAAAGGTGLIACQWLKHLGVRVIGTVGSDAKAELALSHGCSEVIVYTRDDVVNRVRELTRGAFVPVVFDSVGRDTFEASLSCLSVRGTLVSFGNASGKPSLPDVTLLARKGSVYLTRPTLGDYTRSRKELEACANTSLSVLQEAHVRPVIGQRFALPDVAQAHAALESRRTTGSTLLIPPTAWP